MDLLKKMGRRLASSLPGKASHLDVLGEAMYSERYSVSLFLLLFVWVILGMVWNI